nr:E3 ubiquitin-protein ligase Praja-2 [Ipomoea batatas]
MQVRALSSVLHHLVIISRSCLLKSGDEPVGHVIDSQMDSNAEQQEDFRFQLEGFRSRLENMRFRQVHFWSRQLLTVYQRILILIMAHPEYLRFRTSSLTTDNSGSWSRRPGNVLVVVEDLWSQLEDLWYQRDFSSRQLVRVGLRIISFLTSHPQYLRPLTSSHTTTSFRIQERIQAQIAGIFNDLVELELQANFVDVDYLDAQGLDELVEHLAETDGLRSGDTRPLASSRTTPSLRIHERIRAQIAGISNDLEELELQANLVDVDYLDALGLDESVEHGLRRGAPPAAVSVVNSLPCVVIKDHEQLDDNLACAICKDSLSVGSVVNQLPCSHVYHPSCILPWLSSRNTCPLCRYELPTDDQDYEVRKRLSGNEFVVRETQQLNMYEGSSSDAIDDAEAMEPREFGDGRTEQGEEVMSMSGSGRTTEPQELGQGGRSVQEEAMSMSGSDTRTTQRRWFFQALVAQVVSFGGIALTLWLGNRNQLTEKRRSSTLFSRTASNHPLSPRF